MCREADGNCDVAEYCTGESPTVMSNYISNYFNNTKIIIAYIF